MKKLVFALQVLVLMTMFPLYMITELNKVETKATGSKIHPVVNEKLEDYRIQTPLEVKDENFIVIAALGCLLEN